jgi:hypothetical protein
MTPQERTQQRLAELAALPTGWLDGEGEALDPEGLAWASALVLALQNPCKPYCYPTPEGDLSVEWDLPGYSIDARFFLKARRIESSAFNLQYPENSPSFDEDLEGLDLWLTAKMQVG